MSMPAPLKQTFVEPQLVEQASLEDVTLFTGGIIL
jgi:hypothetical protein